MSTWLLCLVVALHSARPINAQPGPFPNQPVRCHDCNADDNTCNVGECQGVVCIKMETSNMDNDRRTVSKGCSNEYAPTQCKQSGFGSKLITRCTCESDFCNGDDHLNAAGLQPASAAAVVSRVVFLSLSTFVVVVVN